MEGITVATHQIVRVISQGRDPGAGSLRRREMLLRLLVYWALGVDAVIRRQLILAVLCFGTPFAGPVGMLIAMLAGVIFLLLRFYIEGAVGIGWVIANLVGNFWLARGSSGNTKS
jgi:hypothetical protein